MTSANLRGGNVRLFIRDRGHVEATVGGVDLGWGRLGKAVVLRSNKGRPARTLKKSRFSVVALPQVLPDAAAG